MIRVMLLDEVVNKEGSVIVSIQLLSDIRIWISDASPKTYNAMKMKSIMKWKVLLLLK